MSPLDLQELKKALRITHDADDEDLQRRLNASTDYALRYMNREQLPVEGDLADEQSSDLNSGEIYAPSVVDAIFSHVEIEFYRMAPADAEAALKRVHNNLHFYRVDLGF
jgi:hypothetical protein